MKYHYLFVIPCVAVAFGVGAGNMIDPSGGKSNAKLVSQSGFEQILGLDVRDPHVFLSDDVQGQDIVLTDIVQLRGTLPVMSFDETLPYR